MIEIILISLLLGGSINQTAHASMDTHILNQNFEEKVERFFRLQKTV